MNRRTILKNVGLFAGTAGLGTLFPNRAEAQKNRRLGPLNVRDFGAIGDGQSHPLGQSYTTFRRAVRKFPALQWLTDQDTWQSVETDWAAIQSAIDAIPESIPGLPSTVGGIVLFPPGVYRINRSIEVIDNLEHHFRHNIQLNGSNGGSGGFMGCVIEWAGEPSEPILRLFSRDCTLQHLAFRVQPGNSTSVAIDVDQAPGPEHGICSGNTFEYLQIVGANGPFGHIGDGIRLGQTAPTNVEQMFFQKCMISVIDQVCLHIPSETFQSKHHSFIDCTFDRAEFGIKTTTGSL